MPGIVRAQNYVGGWGAWATGYGHWGTAESDRNAAGFDYSSGGQLAGVHYRTDSEHVIGAYFGQSQFHIETIVPTQSANVDGFQSGFYLRIGTDSDYYLASCGFGYDDYETQRQINTGAVIRTADGNYSGAQAAIYTERGKTWNFSFGDVQPLVGLQYIYNYQDDFVETGAMALNLNVSSIDIHSLRSVVGSRFSKAWWASSFWQAVTNFRALWMHEYANDHAQLSSQFLGGGTFAPRGIDLGRDWVMLGAGATLTPGDALSLYVNYDVQLGNGQSLHVGSGGVALAW